MNAVRSEAAWVVLLLVLLVPVAVHLTGHRGATTGGGPSVALEGAASLDSILEAYSGRHVLLNFWATWCTPCMRELPVLEAALSASDGEVGIVAIDISDPDPSAFREYASRAGLSFPLIWIDPGEAEDVMGRFALPALLPVTVLLDGEGREVARFSGARDEAFFTALLSDPPSDPEEGPDSTGREPGAGSGLHINVVGTPGDPSFEALAEEAVALAGSGGVSVFDPSDPADSSAMSEQFLPSAGFPYAQACVGDACGRPAHDSEALRLSVESLR